MPLSELVYRMAKGKTDQSSSQDKNFSSSIHPYDFVPENDFVELVWENGQIQSSRARKLQSFNNLQSPKLRDNKAAPGNATTSSNTTTKMGNPVSVLGQISMLTPCVELGSNQDEDIDPWLNYPITESPPPQHNYPSDFLPELSVVTVNESSSQSNFSSFDKTCVGNAFSLDHGNMPKVSLKGDDKTVRSKTSATTHLCPASSSQQCQDSFPCFRSRIAMNNGDNIVNTSHHSLLGDAVHPTAGGPFPSFKTQKQALLPPSPNSSPVMNFSHFSRPAALVKSNLQNIRVSTVGLGTSSLEHVRNKNKFVPATNNNPSETLHVDLSAELCNEPTSHCHPIMVSSKADAKPGKELDPADLNGGVSQEDDSKNDKSSLQNFVESTNKGFTDGEKTMEPVVTSSSVCSGNSVDRASDDPRHNLKRKTRDTEESEDPSEDIEEEWVGVKKAAHARGGTGSKRSRAAEVHNLSERRRRDRINEKMRALQELIPNCNKVDKASMLDEAIEYLKTLQLQVQLMSMGTGLYMPTMMLPPGMPHMHTTHMAQFSPMGIGMGMGYGIGMPDLNAASSGCSMMQVPPMHGPHFPGPLMSGPSAFHGMAGSNLQMFGHSRQGLPMGFPCAPLMPMSRGPLLTKNVGLNASGLAPTLESLDSAPASVSKDSTQDIHMQSMQNDGATNSMNQTNQTTDEHFEPTSLVQSNGQASEVADDGVL